jgi:hypothetical protein
MAIPLGRSDHPHCSAHTNPITPKPFASPSQNPKASTDVPLKPIHPPLPSQQPPPPATTKIFVHVHLRGHPSPVLLLWWPDQPEVCGTSSRVPSFAVGLSIADNTAALEWSNFNQKKVSYCIFIHLHRAKYIDLTNPSK